MKTTILYLEATSMTKLYYLIRYLFIFLIDLKLTKNNKLENFILNLFYNYTSAVKINIINLRKFFYMR